MKTVLGIFARDLKALLRNPIATLVVGALLVLPGLYAWYCIVANWDPYANTGNVPVAIVNHDEGAESDLTGAVDIGAQVVDKLKENDSIDWRFYEDEGEALQDTELSLCYATIVLPADLSRNVIGIFEGSESPPTIYYYPNEKPNAVATKVTDSAAQTLVRQVNQQFSSTVNETLLETVQGVADKAERKADGVRASALAEIRSAQADIDKIIASLDDAQSSMTGWRNAVAGSQGTLTGISEQLPVIEKALAKGSEDAGKLQSETDKFSGSFAQAILNAGATATKLSGVASSSLGKASTDVSTVSGALNSIIAQLQSISDDLLDDDAVKDVRIQIDDTLEKLRSANSALAEAVDRASSTADDMNDRVKKTADNAGEASDAFTTSVMPQLSTGVDGLAASLSELSGAIGQFEPQVGELKGVLGQTDGALERAGSAVADAKVLLASVSKNLKATITDLGAIGSALQVDQIAELLDVDPDNLGQFVSSPVQMVTEKVYPVSNYGTAVAPFYTNLALWIGCFILISLIKLEVDSTGFERASTTQRYFGRWLLFIMLSLLQSQVICGVDILLGIDCANPGLFMLSGAVCSFVYMNLLYALVIAFRNIGKTLCILLLIMQVPGSSGMYPIEMMPGFFQGIHPALPFTYGIGAMREALCGMYGTTLFGDLAILLAVVPLSLVLGLMFRPYLMNLTNMFDAELRATGFMAGEEHGTARESDTIRRMIRALSSNDAYRDDAEERAWAFNRRYPRLRRAGTVAICAIPFAFVLLMAPWDVKVNTRLTWLMIMLAVLLVVLFALIVLEYVHRTIADEARMLGADLMGEDFAEYVTLADQVDDARRAAEAETERFIDEAADDLLGAVPPLSDELLAMIPATAKKSGPKHAATPADTGKRGAHARKRKKRSGAARDIFFTDMRLGFKSVVGVIVIVLLVITPSMYAWFNIAGSWDPYSSTGNLKVAVANTDEGYKGDLIPIRMNVGSTLVSQLRGNDNFDWTFVDEEQALEGVSNGSYYAAIVIPPDFSQNLMTYLTEDSEYPDVVYYTNEKENPIAPIITQKGADSIQENIRATFAERIDEVGLTVAYDLIGYVTQPRVSGYALKMSGHLDDATRDMGTGATELKSLSDLSATVSDVVSAAGSALEGITRASTSAKEAVGTAKDGAKDATAAFEEAAALAKDLLADGGGGIDELVANVDDALATLQTNSAKAPEVIDTASSKVKDWTGVLQDIRDLVADAGEIGGDVLDADDGDGQDGNSDTGTGFDVDAEADALVAKLDAAIALLRNLSSSLDKASSDASGIPGSVAEARVGLSELASEAEDGTAAARSFSEDAKSAVDGLKGTMSDVSGSAATIVGGVEDTVAGLSGSTDGLSSQLASLASRLSESGGKLESIVKNVEGAKKRLAEALDSGDVDKVRNVLLGSDVSVMAQRLAEPIDEQRDPLFPVGNYGSSMAPFYTVLSLWVGALVMISTMRVHVVEERLEELRRRYAKVRPRHEFFGRYGIFGFISLLQSALVLLGDMLFLHIQCVHPVQFMLLGLFVGQVFCLIVYTLTELFGDVGKALCVILLIMQVAASGGTFPVEMLDPLLINIVPFLPFYHAMGLLQECVAGMNAAVVVIHAGALIVAIGIMLLIGVVVRKPFRKLNDFFEAQLEKTGYM